MNMYLPHNALAEAWNSPQRVEPALFIVPRRGLEPLRDCSH